MNKILLALALLLSTSASIMAQEAEASKLTIEQKEQIIKIDRDYDKKFEEVGRNSSLTALQKKTRKRELAKEKRDKINAIVDSKRQATKQEAKKQPASGERTYKYEYNTELVNSPKTRAEALKSIDIQLAQIKEAYRMEEANIKESSRDNTEQRRRLEALKSEYKRKKKRLEDERKSIKEGYPNK